MRILFCNIGWLKYYEGLEEQRMQGGGSWVEKSGSGGEIYNFYDNFGVIEGFVMIHSQLNINRLGANDEDDSIDGVLVIWVSKYPTLGGLYIIGWYKNATVFRKFQQCSKRSIRSQNENCYNIIADSTNCTLLPVEERTFNIPRVSNKNSCGMGQSNVWFAEGEKNKIIVKNVIEYINNYNKKQSKKIIKCKDVEYIRPKIIYYAKVDCEDTEFFISYRDKNITQITSLVDFSTINIPTEQFDKGKYTYKYEDKYKGKIKTNTARIKVYKK